MSKTSFYSFFLLRLLIKNFKKNLIKNLIPQKKKKNINKSPFKKKFNFFFLITK
jgi:hypothetical protein